ncbi:MAG: hypothetical protein L0387_28385 [Acidobacteria bacterium]|nr:hypothetical protein [Acidobacteriota bacterium]MCI0625518.1 hypothetical protein [Acidobacteriota bacterium]MCI0721069.1 hypothetical protein [Acidobacteriota bacterium]
MKAHLYRTILATVMAIPLGVLGSDRLFAQACAPFPAGVVPFAMLHYISAPNSAGDRLMAGEMGGRIKEGQIPLPSFPNQRFCGSVQMAPGLFVEAYVPTQRELGGDFSAFGVPLDPATRRFNLTTGEFHMDPFPGNLIPIRWGFREDDLTLFGFRVWRIPSSAFSVTLSVPIVLSLAGTNNSFYTSELTLVNRGTADLMLEFTYAGVFGEAWEESGNVTDHLPAGQQRILPDAIAYVKSLGLPISTSGGSGGTLTVRASGLASPTDLAATVRTTTALAEGRAGLAYSGNGMWKTFTGATTFYESFDSPYICGLRQNATDRSNVAVMHAGNPEDGVVVLRLTVTSGNPPFESRTLPDIVLGPGGFHQINEVLISNGLSLSNGYVRVERVSGTAPYYAYGVINDQVNSDGSFVPPVLPTDGYPELRLTIPVIVETEAYTSELILTNTSASQQKVDFSFVAEGIQVQSHRAHFSIELSAGQQLLLPNFVQYLRDRGIPGIGPRATNYVGALIATVPAKDRDGNDGRGVFIGARTSTPSKDGGQFGVFYPGFPLEPDRMATTSAWVYGLQQNSETRTNLALVNSGLAGGDPNTFRIELFDGSSGQKVNTIDGITLDSQGWVQIGNILNWYAPGTASGYAQVTRITGKNPFIAYAIVNDGAQPGQRTGDGAFVPMQLDVPLFAAVSSGAGYWDY